MGKRLVITEKPSVARDIAAALGGFSDHEEWLEGDDFVVTWAIGHLLELAEPQDYDKKYGSWSVKNLPILPEEFQIKPREGQKKRLDLIRKLGRRDDVEGIVNAADAGREGELIYRRIVEYTELGHLPQQRLWLQSMTKDAIRHAFDSLRPGQDLDRLADSAWCRAVGDWLVGMNATRALTQRLKSRGDTEPWSAGRVQTPTLNLLVVREREILAHVPRPYWEIVGTFAHADQTWEARFWDPEAKAAVAKDDDEEGGDPEAKPSRLFDRARVDRLMAHLSQAKQGDASEKRRKSKQNPPLLFDLTTLQREGNRRFGFSARRTLDAAQRLYEQHKLLTYPRTDSRYLPGDYEPKVMEILESLQATTDWRQLATEIAAAPQNLGKLLDDTKVSDHFAIVPTGKNPESPLRSDDERIYELVLRQFLAALMGPATWSNVERIVSIPVPDEKEARFRVTTRSLEEPGFHSALGTAQEASRLPALIPGQDDASGVKVDVAEVREEAKETKPPARYSEAQLLRMMETAGERVEDEDLSGAMKDSGLGTPATRADTIEGLIRKAYARRVDGRMGPTSKGIRLMDVLDRLNVGALASPKLTGEWEHALQQVQQGQTTRAEFLARLKSYTAEVTDSLIHFEHEDLYAKEPPLGTCPNCSQGKVIETSWGYRCERNTGAGAECNFMIWKDRAGRYIDRALIERMLRDRKSGPVVGFVDRGGRSQEAALHLEMDEEKGRWTLRIEYEGGSSAAASGPEVVGEPIGPCPAHEDCQIIETDRRFVCRKVLDKTEKSGPQLPKMVCQRDITAEEALRYFGEEGKTDFLEGFISKRGRPFTGLLFRKNTGKHGFEFPPRAGKAGEAGEAAGEDGKAAKKPARGRGRAARPAKAEAADGAGAATEAVAAPKKRAASAKAAGAKAAAKPKAKAGAKAAGAKAKKAAAPPPVPAAPKVKSKGAAKSKSKKMRPKDLLASS